MLVDAASIIEIIYAVAMVWAITAAIAELQFTLGQRRYYHANHINGVRRALNRFYLAQLRSDLAATALMLVAALVALTEHYQPRLIRPYHLPAALVGCLALAGILTALRIVRRLRSRRRLSVALADLEAQAQKEASRD